MFSGTIQSAVKPGGNILMLLVLLHTSLSGCSMIKPSSQAQAPDAPPTSAVEAAPPQNPYLAERSAVPVDASSRFEHSKLAIEQGEWLDAKGQLHSLVKDYPELSGPCLNLALVYRHLDDSEQADFWFKQSIDRNSNNLLAYNQYGIFLREQGRFEQAESIYLQALAIWEPHADTHRNIGILYDLYLGNKKNALRHFYRYQALQDFKDKIVAGWIVDLERQLSSVERVN